MTAAQPITVAEVAAWWPVPDAQSHKYTRGVVGIDAGSASYPGAGLLAVAGALGAGPGMVRYLGQVPSTVIVHRYPSVVAAPGQVQAMVLGSGWGELPDAKERLQRAVALQVPLVIDADALGLLPQGLPGNSLITPHAGELARLLGADRVDVESDPIGAATQAASQLGVTVLLKGAIQPVVTPEAEVWTAIPGPAWTGQAGSGDVLAGACGTLLAAGLPAWQAGLLAASLQAITATRYLGPHTPDVQAARFPEVVGEITRPRVCDGSPW